MHGIIKKYCRFFPLVLIVIAFVVFSPTFFNDFQREWDDTWQLLENPYVLDATWKNVKHHFVYFYHGQYSPINTLIYIAIYKLFGFNPLAFHTLCLLLHILNMLLTYYLVRDILKTLQPSFSHNQIAFYAFFIALIFAIHPLQVESVAWISASKVVLYAFFTLIALWCYAQYILTYRWGWFIMIIIAYALSFGSKEQAIILPLNLLLFDYAYRRFDGIGFKKSFIFKRVVLEKIPFVALALLFWYFSVENNLGVITAESTYPFYQRVLIGMHSFMEYLFRFLAPVKLYYYYFFPMRIGEQLPWNYWIYPFLIILVGSFVWSHYKKGNTLIVFGFLFFLINIFLVLHIIPTPREMVTADRYMYLSIMGLSLIMVWYIGHIYKNYSSYKKWIPIPVLIYTFFLGAHTFIRTQDWKDSDQVKSNIKTLIEKRKAEAQPIINNPL